MNLIIKDITMDEFSDLGYEGIGWLIGTGRVDEEKRGRWIKGQYMSDIDSCLYNEYTCSVCGMKELHKYPYCRNCGAKMEE